MSFSNPRLDFVQRLSPEVVVLLFDGDQAIWSKGKLRKTAICVLSGQKLAPGTLTYRPVGNQQYRARRISAEALDAAIAKIEVINREGPAVEPPLAT